MQGGGYKMIQPISDYRVSTTFDFLQNCQFGMKQLLQIVCKAICPVMYFSRFFQKVLQIRHHVADLLQLKIPLNEVKHLIFIYLPANSN